MPNFTDTVLTRNDSVAADCKFISVNRDAYDCDAATTPIGGGWLSTEKARVIKWTQMYKLGNATTDGTMFSGKYSNTKRFEKAKAGFFDDIQRRMMIGFEEEIISGFTGWQINTTLGSSATTMNVDIQPPPRRHGGIYKVQNRKRQSLHRPAANEERARRLLQRLIGFQRYARYIRDGFITHRGASGRVYQIFPGMTHMRVWFKGQRVEDLCLCIKDYSIPPTDSVVMRLLMLEHSEAEFREQANISRSVVKMDQQIIDESIASIRALAG